MSKPSRALSVPRRVRAIASVAALVVLVAAAFVAGRISIDGVSDSTNIDSVSTQESLTWKVQDESVGRSLTFVGQIKATTRPGPLANSDGVITDVMVPPDGQVDVGDVLFDVELRPVIAGIGKTPAFRPLQANNTGDDVIQLRAYLCDRTYLTECDDNPKFTTAMTKAVNDMHVELGLAKDGIVKTGDILWFDELPLQVRPSENLVVGNKIAAADRPLMLTAGDPTFVLTVTRDQASLIPIGSSTTFGGGNDATGVEGVVTAVGPVVATADTAASDSATEPAFEISVNQVSSEDAVCVGVERCIELLGGRATGSVEVDIEVVPERTGPGVPIGAITTDANGETYVTMTDSTRTVVLILGTSGGIAIVDGVATGDTILLDKSSAPAATAAAPADE